MGEIQEGDAHTLFYTLKMEMAKRQASLFSETMQAISYLQLEVQDNMPLVREYVYQLHTLSQQVLYLSGKIDKEKFLQLFRLQVLDPPREMAENYRRRDSITSQTSYVDCSG